MQQSSELPPLSEETKGVQSIPLSYATRLGSFVGALRSELGEMSLELLTAELRQVADTGLAWILTVRRNAGSIELLRAKVAEGPALDETARAALRARIAAHFAQ